MRTTTIRGKFTTAQFSKFATIFLALEAA